MKKNENLEKFEKLCNSIRAFSKKNDISHVDLIYLLLSCYVDLATYIEKNMHSSNNVMIEIAKLRDCDVEQVCSNHLIACSLNTSLIDEFNSQKT